MKTTDPPPKPIDVPPDDTTGSDTERNYRYQHAYGVILLIGAANNQNPYVSIYAEHHEDFLCERLDGMVDGYQVKTRNPDDREWQINHEPLRKSIKRFVKFNFTFPDDIHSLNFVSNVGYSNPGMEINDLQRLRQSPIKFLNVVKESSCVDEIEAPFNQTFLELCDYCECSPEDLFATLQKIELIIGPGRDSFDSEIVTTHLSRVHECSSFSVPTLNEIRDDLIHKVWLASHIVETSSKHWYPINKISSDNPHITAKRISIETVVQIIQDKMEPPFRYRDSPTIALGNGKGNLEVLRKKMRKGNLLDQLQTMERRSISAEQNLIEFAIRNSIGIEAHLAQLEGIVQGECDEAYLHASLSGQPIGPNMLDDVYARLNLKAKESVLVLRQPYELLIGIAGLLTGECKVWWSEHFDLDGGE